MEGGGGDDDEIFLNLINFDFFEEIDFPLLPPPPIIACSRSSNNQEVVVVEEEEEEEKNSNTTTPTNSDSSLIDEVEKYLMKEDINEEEGMMMMMEVEDNFFSDFLLDIDQSTTPTTTTTTTRGVGVVVVSNDLDCSNPAESNVSDDDVDDQITKKRKRQMRNRDAALRSRERKKLYVKDLEMKSRYLESECKRLQYLVQCYAAQNQSLHLNNNNNLQQKNKTASSVSNNKKQESAVLLLESLLLGSLLWLMGSICLFSLPGLLFHRPNPPPADVLVSVGSDNLVEVVSLRAKNRRNGFRRLLKFFRRKRWKATRLKIKQVFPSVADAVTHAVFV